MTRVRIPRRAARLLFWGSLYVAWVVFLCWPVPGPTLPEISPTTSPIFEPASAPTAVVPLEATAYCACPICCGRWADGWTASGTRATAGRTLAADPALFSAGTCLALGELGHRIVEDTGSAILGARVDVYFDTHQEALDFGRRFVSWGVC